MNVNDSLTLALAGLDDTRSKFKAAHYTTPFMSDQELLSAYEGSSLVSRVVNMPVDDTFREWREWQAETDDINKIEAVEAKFGIKAALSDAYSDARLFGDGYILIDNGDDPTQPLVPEIARPLRFVVKVDRWQISEGEYDFDPLSPQYNKPGHYEIMGANADIQRIHPTRIVHLIGRKRKQAGSSMRRMGQSSIIAMFDDLKAVDAVMANIADMTFEAKIDVMKINNLFEMVQDPAQMQAVQAKLRLAMTTKAVNGALILDANEEDWEQKQITFATLPDVIDRFQIAAAGAAQIPRSRLFGIQTAGLGNTGASDARLYFDHIKSMQENIIQPACHVLDGMIIKTALGSIPADVYYNWRSLFQMDDKEMAEIGVQIVKKYKDAVDAGIFDAGFATAPMINELTEAGVSPGLEAAYSEWLLGADDNDDDSGMGDLRGPDQDLT